MYKRKMTVPGPKRVNWNANSKFINKKHQKLFDETLTHDYVVNKDLLEANMQYMMEILNKGVK